MTNDDARRQENNAELYRMVTAEHICPFGLKSKDLLERKGFEVKDHLLKTRDQADAFKQKHQVETTPQAFIKGERIGGYDELREHFGLEVRGEDEVSYKAIIAIFSTAFLMALAVAWVAIGTPWSIRTLEWFVAISMCLLGLQKLKDLKSFSNMFLNYDLLAQRWVPYSYVYPFVETLAGILMLASVLTWLSAPAALFIGTIGAVSVFKAVYIDKRELKCACAGGDSSVPLGFVSLTENLIMILMGVWMPVRMYVL